MTHLWSGKQTTFDLGLILIFTVDYNDFKVVYTYIDLMPVVFVADYTF